MNTFLRRLKGALGNGLVWGASWAAAAAALWASVLLFSGGGQGAWQLLPLAAASAGWSGLTTGLVFSAYLGIAHRRSSLGELSVWRLALAGGATAAAVALLPQLVWMASVGVGLQGLPPAMFAFVAGPPLLLGTVTAGGTVYVAKKAGGQLAAEPAEALEREQDGVADLLGS